MAKLRCLVACFVLPAASRAFQLPPTLGVRSGQVGGGSCGENSIHVPSTKDWRSVALRLSRVEVTSPTPDEAAALGARDWPQQLKRDSWSESIGEGTSATRYVLDGSGTVESFAAEDDGPTKTRVGPGSLVEANGPVELEWKVDGGGDMIILTPGFEEGGLLLGVFAAFVALCGALIAVS